MIYSILIPFLLPISMLLQVLRVNYFAEKEIPNCQKCHHASLCYIYTNNHCIGQAHSHVCITSLITHQRDVHLPYDENQ